MELRSLIDPRSTLVLTQECQRGIIGDLALSKLPEAAQEIGLVEKVARIVEAGRDAGCGIIHCIAECRPNHPASGDHAPILRAGKAAAGSEWDPRVMEIAAGIRVAPTDIVTTRTVQVSPIIGTEVPTMLHNLGVSTVVAVGVSANLGIPHVALDCVNLGYNVVIPRDAVVGYPLEYTDAIMKYTLGMVAKICTTDELVEAWGA